MSAATESVIGGGDFSAALARFARGALFLSIFLLFWISVSPFHDLTDPARLATVDRAVLLKQIAVSAAAILALAFILMHGWREFTSLFHWALVATALALIISAAVSADVELSQKRVVLAMFIIVTAAACAKLPVSIDSFSKMLAIAAIAVLALCYGGVALLPSLSIHHIEELVEPELAGSWRGLFVHKNQAGGAMVVLTFIGIFVARTGRMITGSAIAVLSAVFLLQTGSKTSAALLPLVLLLSVILMRMKGNALQIATVVGVVGLFNLLTVGSVLLPGLQSFVQQLASDATFTNRTDIWRFAADNISAHPLFGYGFQAFWGTTSTVYGGAGVETWAAAAGNAHNSYVDTALSAGLIGLAATVWWLVIQPARDLEAAQRRQNDRRVTALFVQIWLFAVIASALETIFFEADNPVWFATLIAVFGLRFHATQTAVGR